jgi:hypothetical protein
MEQKLNFNVTGNEFEVRQGTAAPIPAIKSLSIAGTIGAPAIYYEHRYYTAGPAIGELQQMVDKKTSIVIVDRENMTISLATNPNHEHGTHVVGKLELTNELKQFHINENHLFTREQLLKLLKFNRRFFNDQGQYQKLVDAYTRMNVKTASDLSQESDQRGNKNLAFNKTVQAENLPTFFVLNIPIFKGFEDVIFSVEICLEATDAAVRFWFESVELLELIESRKQEILEKEVAKMNELPIIWAN